MAARALTASLLPLLLALATTLTLRGYQFGGGNHAVYLIAPLQKVHPELLRNDWWTTHTLQYHLAHTHLTAGLMRLGIERPAFFVLYLALAVLLHLAWLRITLAVGLDGRAYLLSVLLYYLSAGGTALGTYQFLQDASFLPGNVANVAMLWAIAYFIGGRVWLSAVCFALAGLFHLNHAIVALGFWFIAGLAFRSMRNRQWVVGGLLILLFSLPNLIPAAQLSLTATQKLPLREFVDLYVHLRHPHHYDPLSWPPALWLSFLWPIPFCVLAYRRLRLQESGPGISHALPRAAFTFGYFIAMAVVAFVFAGVVFVSEPLIQMSLFRFSIYPKLLSCIGAAAFLLHLPISARRATRLMVLAIPLLLVGVILIVRRAGPVSAATFVAANLTPLLLFTALLAAGAVYALVHRPADRPRGATALTFLVVVGLLLVFRNWLGLRLAVDDADDRDYLAVCHYARDHTPVDAVFLVPPNEQLFRLHARRAIVVNFKNVPQLSSEMGEWKRRLEAVIDTPLSGLPRRFDQAHAAIAARYDALPLGHFLDIAPRYNATYLVTARPLPGLVPVFETPRYRLYDLRHTAAPARLNEPGGRSEGDPRWTSAPSRSFSVSTTTSAWANTPPATSSTNSTRPARSPATFPSSPSTP